MIIIIFQSLFLTNLGSGSMTNFGRNYIRRKKCFFNREYNNAYKIIEDIL